MFSSVPRTSKPALGRCLSAIVLCVACLLGDAMSAYAAPPPPEDASVIPRGRETAIQTWINGGAHPGFSVPSIRIGGHEVAAELRAESGVCAVTFFTYGPEPEVECASEVPAEAVAIAEAYAAERDAVGRAELWDDIVSMPAPHVPPHIAELPHQRWISEVNPLGRALPLTLGVSSLLGLAFGFRRRRDTVPTPRPVLSAVVAAVIIGAVALLFARLPVVNVSPDLPMVHVAHCLVLACVGTWTGFAVAGIVRLARGGWRDARWREAALDFTIVFAWSVFVRFALTEANILTDGGTGYRRLQFTMPGLTGFPATFELLRGQPANVGDMWSALRLPSAIATLAAPATLAFARALDLRRSVALLAGLMLASLPIHAALYRSDFIIGAGAAVGTLGAAIAAVAIRDHKHALLWPAAACFVFAFQLRAEAPLVIAWAGIVALPALRRLRSPHVAGAIAWLVSAWVGVVLATRAGGYSTPSNEVGIFKRIESLLSPHVLTLFSQPVAIPPWYWIPLLALPVLPWWIHAARRPDSRYPLPVALVVLVALAAGLAPVFRFGTWGIYDSLDSPMEWPRYGTWGIACWCIVSASVWLGISRRVGQRFGEKRQRVVLGLTFVAVVATPLLSLGYLGTIYQHRAEEVVFRDVLAMTPDGCTIVVPDDEPEALAVGNTVEIGARFEFIAAEFLTEAGREIDAITIIPISRYPKDDHPEMEGCWYFFDGVTCQIGVHATGESAHCRWYADQALAEPVLAESIAMTHHRHILRPQLRDAGFYPTELTLRLYPLTREALGDAPNAGSPIERRHEAGEHGSVPTEDAGAPSPAPTPP